MVGLLIGEVARRSGLPTSALRLRKGHDAIVQSR
jgi:hypothetical protein